MALSANMKAGLTAQEMSLDVRLIIEIDHADLGTPIRLADSSIDIAHNGDTYTACGVNYIAPEQREEGFRQATVTLNNVDQVMTPTIRSLPSGITATVRKVSVTNAAASPPDYDTIEGGEQVYIVHAGDVNETTAQLTLVFNDISLKQHPYYTFNMSDFRGMHHE